MSKRLSNGWTDESTPPVPHMPVNLTPSKSETRRRLVANEGSSAPGVDGGVASPSSLTVAGVKIRMPGWLPAWWEEFTSNKAVMVEVISRAVFPLMFCIFNLVYWPWYLLWALVTVQDKRRFSGENENTKDVNRYYWYIRSAAQLARRTPLRGPEKI